MPSRRQPRVLSAPQPCSSTGSLEATSKASWKRWSADPRARPAWPKAPSSTAATRQEEPAAAVGARARAGGAGRAAKAPGLKGRFVGASAAICSWVIFGSPGCCGVRKGPFLIELLHSSPSSLVSRHPTGPGEAGLVGHERMATSSPAAQTPASRPAGVLGASPARVGGSRGEQVRATGCGARPNVRAS